MAKDRVEMLVNEETAKATHVLIKMRADEKQNYLKAYPERLWEICKDDDFNKLPPRFIAWILKNTDFNGRITGSIADYEKATGYAHSTCVKQFQIANKAGFIVRTGTIGPVKTWILNPHVFFKGNPAGKRKTAKELREKAKETNQTLFM